MGGFKDEGKTGVTKALSLSHHDWVISDTTLLSALSTPKYTHLKLDSVKKLHAKNALTTEKRFCYTNKIIC